jgi:crotonobetaine/carnitine-CoA ligase
MLAEAGDLSASEERGRDLWPNAAPPDARSPTDVRAVLEYQARAHAGDPFVTFEGETLTFAALDKRANRVANALWSLGVQPGDKVALLMRNGFEFLYSWFGLAKLGAVMVPVNTSMRGAPLEYIVGHSDARGLVADDDLAQSAIEIGLGDRLDWMVTRSYEGSRPAGCEAFESLLTASVDAPPAVELHPDTALGIIYTSGTTGMPKGVILPHYSYVNTGRYYGEHLRLTDADRMHTCLPLFHCNAQQTTVMSALVGARHVTLHEKFSLSRFWSWMHDCSATVTNVMGTMLTLLHKQAPSELDRGHDVRYVVSAPIPVEFYDAFEDRFGVTLLEGYGLTETGTMCVTNPVNAIRPGALGLRLPHTEARIVDEGGADVAADVVGEIIARPTTKYVFMTGYYKDAAATDAAVREGWFHTGDLGKRDADGYFYYVDRKKDMIRRRGENISSFMLEKLVCDHDEVLESAAVGVPSELGEEDVKIYVVLRPGSSLEPAELSDWCQHAIPDFMQPRFVEIISELPKTQTGRVEKYVLRSQGAGDAWDRDAAAPR